MLDGKKLLEANEKLMNITQDLSWVEFHNKETNYDLSTMSVKSLILQLKDVVKLLEEVVNESA